MGKGSGKAKMPKDDATAKALKEQGPGMSDPVGPILQLTGMGQAPGMAGQIDFSSPGFMQQLSALPPELLQQIRMAQQPRPVPTSPKKLGV